MYVYKAKIISITDGDTVKAEIDLGFRLITTQRLRLNRINTPEMHGKTEVERAKAKNAKDYIEKLLLNKQVIIRTEKADAFDRWLVEIEVPVDSAIINVSDELLVKGHAVLYKP